MRFLMYFLIFALMVPISAQADGTWKELLERVEKASKSHENPKTPSAVGALTLPDSYAAESNTPSQGQMQAEFVLTYKCTNPAIPQCLWDLRINPEDVDKENCRDLTKLYLKAVESYDRCVSRRAESHAKQIVRAFNCYVKELDNCPRFYGDN